MCKPGEELVKRDQLLRKKEERSTENDTSLYIKLCYVLYIIKDFDFQTTAVSMLLMEINLGMKPQNVRLSKGIVYQLIVVNDTFMKGVGEVRKRQMLAINRYVHVWQ
jgi:hypothetical protein